MNQACKPWMVAIDGFAQGPESGWSNMKVTVSVKIKIPRNTETSIGKVTSGVRFVELALDYATIQMCYVYDAAARNQASMQGLSSGEEQATLQWAAQVEGQPASLSSFRNIILASVNDDGTTTGTDSSNNPGNNLSNVNRGNNYIPADDEEGVPMALVLGLVGGGVLLGLCFGFVIAKRVTKQQGSVSSAHTTENLAMKQSQANQPDTLDRSSEDIVADLNPPPRANNSRGNMQGHLRKERLYGTRSTGWSSNSPSTTE